MELEIRAEDLMQFARNFSKILMFAGLCLGLILACSILSEFDSPPNMFQFAQFHQRRTHCVSNLKDIHLKEWFATRWNHRRSPQRIERVCQALTRIGGVDDVADLFRLNQSDLIEIGRLGKVSFIDRKILTEVIERDRLTRHTIPGCLFPASLTCEIAKYFENKTKQRVWKQFETTNEAYKMKHVTVNGHGTILAITEKDEIFYGRREDFSEWKRMDGALKQIDVGGENGDLVVGVNAGDYIWTRRIDGQTGQPTSAWKHLDGFLSHVSVCGNGAFWGVNRDGHVYYRASVSDGSKWRHVSEMMLKQISCDKKTNEVYGVNEKDEIFVRQQISSSNWIGVEWKLVFGRLRYISSGNGVVVGANEHHNVYEMIDEKKDPQNVHGWKNWDGKLRQMEVSPNGELVVAVDENGAVYSRSSI